MKKSDIAAMPHFFDRYINLVEDIDILEALQEKIKFSPKEIFFLNAMGDLKYQADKWTVKDILQHLIDTERILTYRALRFARQDKTILPGYDEELYGATAGASKRNVEELLSEYQAVRNSTIFLFKSFSQEAFNHQGVCFNVSITVLALGFVIAGHQIHHFNIIKEKYQPLLNI